MLIELEALKAHSVEIFGQRYVDVRDIDDAPTIDPIRAAGGCRCGECRYKDTNVCPAYDTPMHRTSLRIKHCSEGEPREVWDDV